MRKLLLFFTFLAATFPLAAHAATIFDFTLTGEGNTVTYLYFGDVVPGVYYPRGGEFDSEPIQDIVNGVSGLGGLMFFEQPSPPHSDLIASWSATPANPTGGGVSLFGPKLLSGLPQGFGPTPTLILGAFDLTALDGAPYILTVEPESPSAPTPEPDTLILLATGALGLIYLGSRRRPVDRDTSLHAVSAL
jgi:hypothetical protein